MRRQFQNWYSDQVYRHLPNSEEETFDHSNISLEMLVVKPISAKWLMSLYYYMTANPSIIINGFKEVGLKDKL